MEKIDLKKALSFAWERLRANPVFYVLGLFIAFMAFSVISSAVVGPIAFASFVLNIFSGKLAHLIDCISAALLFVLKCLVLAPLFIGYLKGIRKEYEGGEATIADLFSGFQNYASVIVFSAVMGLMLLAGFAFFILPGLLLCPVFSMGLYYFAEGETGSFGLDAIVKAFKSWSIGLELAALVVFLAAGLAGLLLCCVGLLVTAPLAVATVWHLCRQFASASPCSKPQSDEQIGSPS
jgi:uncharacterized membrane protein